jgi:hypothetical protein
MILITYNNCINVIRVASSGRAVDLRGIYEIHVESLMQQLFEAIGIRRLDHAEIYMK